MTHYLKSGVLVSLPTLFPPHVTARACAPISKKWVIHIKIKSWLRPLGPTTPFFKKKIIWKSSSASYCVPAWLSLHSIQQPSCPPVFDWLGWSGQVQEGHFSHCWHLSGVLRNALPTRVQSPQCTLSIDIWCMTDNKPHCPYAGKIMLTCPLGVVILWMRNGHGDMCGKRVS